MDTEELKLFCKKIKMIWETLGTDDFSLRKDKDSKKFRRSIYVVKDIEKNQLINRSNIKKIRPSNGLHPKYFFKVIGKRTTKKILAGNPLKREFIK
jgi:sialic acid synthase SpsE